jgi:hypothetical protein
MLAIRRAKRRAGSRSILGVYRGLPYRNVSFRAGCMAVVSRSILGVYRTCTYMTVCMAVSLPNIPYVHRI